jgi:cytoskeletal protein RodZ
MPLFKRKDKTTIAELEEYYANQNKNRSSKAWFMALLSLFITIAVIAALFFGGRWLYDLVTGDDEATITTTGETVTGSVPSFGEIRTDDESTDAGESSDVAATDEADNTPEGVVSDEAATTTRDVAGAATGGDSTDSTATTDEIVSTTEIPNTGANELFALLPLLAGLSGYLYSRKRQLGK